MSLVTIRVLLIIFSLEKNLKQVSNIKVIPCKEAVPQHKLLVCDLAVKQPKVERRKFVPRLKTWLLRKPETKEAFEIKFKDKVIQESVKGVDSTWAHLKNCLLKTSEEVCG